MNNAVRSWYKDFENNPSTLQSDPGLKEVKELFNDTHNRVLRCSKHGSGSYVCDVEMILMTSALSL